MTDDMLDLLSMILVLAIVLSIGFGMILPLMSTELMGYNDNIQDKSVLGQYEGIYEEPKRKGITAEEVVLITQVQDSGMPLPRALSINNTFIDVKSTYKLDVIQTGIKVWNLLKNNPSGSGLYTVGYDFKGVSGLPWVESYKVEAFVN